MAKSYRSHEVLNVLETKLRMEIRSGKHNTCWYYLDGKKALRTTIPHGRQPFKSGTQRAIMRQLLLTPTQFDDLIQCPLTSEQYERIVRTLTNTEH